MTQKEKSLCLAIARDEEIENAYKDKGSVFYPICQVQKSFRQKHLPEPWNGNISKAKIMFISSNPSIDQSEVYPTNSWSDDDICAYFENRFKTGKQSDEGENASIRFWSALVKYTNWISAELNIGIKEICPDGKGYKNHYAELNDVIVSTEIVHCKSRGEEGVQECADASFNKWMEKIISLFKGKAIVLVGSIARRYAQEIKSFSHVQKSKISVLCISHPNAHGLSDDDRIEEIRKQI